MSEVVTRFPPSPTGDLHIGGARTALFNWLFARHHGGRFVLRIEDTDRNRYTPEAVEAIYDGLRWLGLDWDGDVVSQFSRVDRHAEVARQMLDACTAYKCFATKEEIDAFREQAKAEKKPPLFRSPWRDRTDHPEGYDYTVRLKAPREGTISIEDQVQGTVTWPAETMDDLILMRSDGTPTYMLAVVVDDHDMGVSHVIRGDDHLTNAARQSLICKAAGWELPIYAHVPLIHGPDGAKMSKRHGATSVTEYRDMGYLPQAMRNYLARLGWSHGDEEFFDDAQMIEWFGLEAVGKSAARFDFRKLEHLNGQHIRATADEDLMAALDGLVASQKIAPIPQERRDLLLAAMPGLKERAKTLLEVIELSYYILADRPLEPDEKASKLLNSETVSMLARLTERLRNASEWSAGATEEIAREIAEAEDLKLGKVAQPLRAALTGRTVSPSVFDVMVTLGREETLARLGDAIGDSG